MTDINTNLNRNPYFDDYVENKKFYRILFKPGTAVQARELNQLQSILQKQINRFGSHVFKNGSIVDGVNPIILDQAHVLRLTNSYTNNSPVIIEDILNSSNNLFVVSQSSDVEAKLHTGLDGSQANAPLTKRLYITYTNTDDTNTKTSVGNISVVQNSNTVTGSGSSFTNYEVGDVITIFETPQKRRVAFSAKIDNIANNISMSLNRKLSFSNTSVSSNNYTIHRNLTAFGIIGTEQSPEVMDIIERTVRNDQSNTVNTAVTSNTFILDFTVANTQTVSVAVNGLEQRQGIDYTANTSAIVMKYNLSNDDSIDILETLNTVKFSGLQAFRGGAVNASDRCTVARNEDGVVFHKGQFLNISPGYLVVADNLIDANNSIVAVDSNESIVTFKADNSLLDNASGFNNEVAPGADRLKIDPILVSANTSNLVNQDAVAVLINFNDVGDVLQENKDPQYNILGQQLAQRKNDTSGSFTIKRFVTDTEPVAANNELIKIITEPGYGYVNGYKVETDSPLSQVIQRGTNTLQRENFENNIVYGNYYRVTNYNGSFAPNERFSLVNNGTDYGYFPASNTGFLSSLSASTPGGSTEVGRGYIKSVVLESGTPGAYDAVYRIYVVSLTRLSGQSPQDAKTIVQNDTVKGGADIILTDGKASLQGTEELPFSSFGERSIRSYTDSNGTYNNSFVVRKFSSVTDTMNADGTIVIDVDDEIDLTGNNSIGAYTTNEINNLIITNVGSEISCNTTGTTTASGNVVTHDVALAGKFHVGDIVQIDSSNKTIITKINSTTTFQTLDVLSDTSGTLKKLIPYGKNIAVDSAMITTDQVNNTLNITVPILNNGNFNAATTVRATYDFNSSNYKPFRKDIRKNVYRRINTANNSANSIGPWDLGVVDIHKVTGLWFLANKNNGNANDTFTDSDIESAKNYVNGNFFEFDSGQRLDSYRYGKLLLTNKGRNKNLVSANATILVRMDAFTVDNSDGEGYFTVDSYPTTTQATANSTTIKFEEIPSLVNEFDNDNLISLRDVIDHRPRYNNKDHSNLLTGVANTSSVDPSNSIDGTTLYGSGNSKNSSLIFKNDSEFVSDYKINTPKRADVYLGELATYTVSVANNGNSVPPAVDRSMRIATVNIPPYPSLTRSESVAAKNTYSGGKLKDISTQFSVSDVTVSVDLNNIRRYTMKDIGTLDQRISNLEYYTSLNSLETEAFNKQIKNNSGIERFKNGIFVEPFISHQFGKTSHNEYRVSIDEQKGHFRPNFKEVLVDNFDVDIVSGSLGQFGQRIYYNHTEEDFIKQDKATKVRPAAPLDTRFNGTLKLVPEYDVGVDSTNIGRIILNPDEKPPVQEGTSTTFGNWRTTSTSRSGRVDITTRVRDVVTTTVNVDKKLETFSNRITDVNISPFIREMAIAFVATGLRPKQEHSFFFNSVNVDDHVAPSLIRENRANFATIAKDGDNAFNLTKFRTFRKGDPLITGPDGSVSGVFYVPKETFLQGDRKALIADVQDLDTERDAIISSASKMFYSNRLGVEKEELIKQVFDVQVTTQTEQESVTTRRRRDPIAQTFFVRGDDATDSEGIFVSSIDLFFRRKASSNGIKVFLCETENGYPNTNEVYKATEVELRPADVNVSNDASVPTNFKFDYPVFLKKDRQYAFVVKPNANDPDYDVYFSELGGVDILTGSAVNTQPYEGIAFMGANQDTWSAIQAEDIKFTLKKAVFSTGSGNIRFFPRNTDKGEFEDIAYVNGKNSIRVGDIVYGMTSANSDPSLTVANVNTAITGVVSSIDDINDQLNIVTSTGNFNNSSAKTFTKTLVNGTTKSRTKYKIAFYRPDDSLLETDNLNINRFVGTSFMSLDDDEYSVIIPQFTTQVFKDSLIDFNHVYNISNTSSTSFPIPNEEEYEYTDNPLVLRSRTNEKLKLGSATGNTSFYLDVNTFNGSTKTSPFIDLRRSLFTAVGNLTKTPDTTLTNFIDGSSISDANTANIYTELFDGLGQTNVRYISQPITLADLQDAEDLRVLITAFKPPRARIDVFARFANQYDDLDNTLYTPLFSINPEKYSDRSNRDDFVELEYRLHTRSELNATDWAGVFNDTTASDYAYVYTSGYTANSIVATDDNTGIAEYDRNGRTFSSYKQFQIKIVTYAEINSPSGFGKVNSSNPAIIKDLRAIALQV